MDKKRWKKISLILDAALSHPEVTRHTYIKDVCGDDPDLLREIHELLDTLNQTKDEERSFNRHLAGNEALLQETAEPGSDMDFYLQGDSIGRWRLTKLLGRGGMGSVYKAERMDESGIRQTGALKIIHKSLVISSHIERFKIEQQILAGLHHAAIAGFIDSGVTTDGIPYMVMEYVEGKPILEYCDHHKLTVNQRIELFKAVCRAVQYAHKSLVIHRDLKSDNILITPEGQVKILDFGIAKLLDPSLYYLSGFETQSGTRLLSLEYASPEQIRGEQVTTSADLYSLGVLLYKLLVGLHPFDVDNPTYRDLERMVLEQEPPVPATRFLNCSDNEMKISVAGMRREDPAGLVKKVKGDLDAIVHSSLCKDPERRYLSLEMLIGDIERHQEVIPILARPDSYGYRLRKLFYRRRLLVSAISLVLIVFTAGIITTLWQANQAVQNARQAEQQAQRAGLVTQFLIDLFEAGDPDVAQGTEISVIDLLAKGVEKVNAPGFDHHLKMNMLTVLGRVHLSLGDYETSIGLLQQALEMAEMDLTSENVLLTADIQTRLGLNYRFTGDLSMADSLFQKAYENRKSVLGTDHPETINSMDDLAAIRVYRSHDIGLADSLFQDVLIRRRRVLDPYDEDLALSLNNLGYIKIRKGELEEALKLYEEASKIYGVALGMHHPSRLRVLSSIAYVHHKLGNLERSESMRRESIAIRREVLGDGHPHLAMSYYYLAELLMDAGRPDEALEYSQKAVEIMQATGTSQRAYPDALILLSRNYDMINSITSAAETYRLASAACVEQRGADAPVCYKLNLTIGEFYIRQNLFSESAVFLQQSYDAMRLLYDPDHPSLVQVGQLLSTSLQHSASASFNNPEF